MRGTFRLLAGSRGPGYEFVIEKDSSMTPATTPASNGIPLLGFGTYPLSGVEAERCVGMALEVGIRHIDTAQMYGNEAEVGRAVAASGLPRSDCFIVTKVDPSNLDQRRFAPAVARSVEALGGPPDLLLIHWPPADGVIDHSVEQLVAERDKGMARAIGVSNFSVAQMRRAQQIAGGSLICNQVEFHPLLDQSRLLAAAGDTGMILTAYCPLARGKAMQTEVVKEIAARHGRPPSEIVLRWITQQGVAAIPMTRKRENAVSNLNSLSITLTQEEIEAISGLARRDGRIISPSWVKSWE
ncbi:aldo/keto reductase [Aestuariivirga sp.]|uniref:aldo/keto reductase n=1 Tax=Aestuariivirga sp. TaxID=2650926 RepID=UPI003BAD0057